jgi:hypothetical protein
MVGKVGRERVGILGNGRIGGRAEREGRMGGNVAVGIASVVGVRGRVMVR